MDRGDAAGLPRLRGDDGDARHHVPEAMARPVSCRSSRSCDLERLKKHGRRRASAPVRPRRSGSHRNQRRGQEDAHGHGESGGGGLGRGGPVTLTESKEKRDGGRAAPSMNYGSLGARFGEGQEGKERGALGLQIGQAGALNPGLKRPR